MNPIEDLTLVIPTYFRQDIALRLMKFWVDKGPKVIVVDGTDKPMSKEKLDGLGTSIIYVHNPVGLYERLKSVLSLITTKYVALAGDDEFYIPSALASCIWELNNDADLVACCGIAIGFCPGSNFVRGLEVYPRLFGYEILQSEPKDRVVSHMSDYEVNQIYAVCKSRDWKIVFQGILEREFPVFAIAEYQFQLYMSFAGKSKVINQLMWLRNRGETNPIRNTDPSLGDQLFIDWYSNKKFSLEKSELIDISAKTLNKISSTYDYNYCRSIAEAGFQVFHDWLKANRTFTQSILSASVMKSIKKFLPAPLKSFAKFLIRMLQLFKNEENIFQEAIGLIDYARKIERVHGVKISIQELYEIEATLKQKLNTSNWID